MQKHFIGLLKISTRQIAHELHKESSKSWKKNGDTHTNPLKTANPHLPARKQTLARKVSCFLKMLKLQREKSKQSYPAGSRASFQKCSMGL